MHFNRHACGHKNIINPSVHTPSNIKEYVEEIPFAEVTKNPVNVCTDGLVVSDYLTLVLYVGVWARTGQRSFFFFHFKIFFSSDF